MDCVWPVKIKISCCSHLPSCSKYLNVTLNEIFYNLNIKTKESNWKNSEQIITGYLKC